MAFERVKLITRRTASFGLTGMLEAGVMTPEHVVDHFIHRFLRVGLAEKDRAAIVDFLRNELNGRSIGSGDEALLREVLYLVLSTPEYQLG